MLRLRRFVWATLATTVAVVLLGALVRATGSGAGCGRSWPTCQGVVLPDLRGATAVEFVHRAASGVALVLVAVMVVGVFRVVGRGHPARRGAVLSGVAIVVEALIGATIVFSEWVADDASVARVISVPLHLVNTLLLLAALTLTAFWLAGGGRLRPRHGWGIPVAVTVGLVLVAGTGAVTALADTLFPKEALDLSGVVTAGEHFLTRLRVLHPFVAAVVGMAAVLVSVRLRTAHPLASRVVVTAVVVDLVAGALNVALLTPIWLSLLHLLVADVLWIAWTWLVASHLGGMVPSDGTLLRVPRIAPEGTARWR